MFLHPHSCSYGGTGEGRVRHATAQSRGSAVARLRVYTLAALRLLMTEADKVTEPPCATAVCVCSCTAGQGQSVWAGR